MCARTASRTFFAFCFAREAYFEVKWQAASWSYITCSGTLQVLWLDHCWEAEYKVTCFLKSWQRLRWVQVWHQQGWSCQVSWAARFRESLLCSICCQAGEKFVLHPWLFKFCGWTKHTRVWWKGLCALSSWCGWPPCKQLVKFIYCKAVQQPWGCTTRCTTSKERANIFLVTSPKSCFPKKPPHQKTFPQKLELPQQKYTIMITTLSFELDFDTLLNMVNILVHNMLNSDIHQLLGGGLLQRPWSQGQSHSHSEPEWDGVQVPGSHCG